MVLGGENSRTKVQVGSRTGAVIRRWIPFPAPASSNAACGFPALRLPDGFASSLIWPIVWRGFRTREHERVGSHWRHRAFRRSKHYSTSSSQSPDVLARASGDVWLSSPSSIVCTRSTRGIRQRGSSWPTLAGWGSPGWAPMQSGV